MNTAIIHRGVNLAAGQYAAVEADGDTAKTLPLSSTRVIHSVCRTREG